MFIIFRNRDFIDSFVCLKKGVDVMTCIQCHDCKTAIHFTPVDEVEFTKRFVEGNEPIYCPACWEKKEKEKNK